ncbi:MAG: hypothetical protein KF734_20620 [Saprospiraceae bacterium]|nr:hypothetical protein [Saprospiraceae bacterium]MCW5923387.1 hypothetical protein [Saprospiraceae bacterium]
MKKAFLQTKQKTVFDRIKVSDQKKIFLVAKTKRRPRNPAAGVVHTIEWIECDWLIAARRAQKDKRSDAKQALKSKLCSSVQTFLRYLYLRIAYFEKVETRIGNKCGIFPAIAQFAPLT